MSVVKIRPRKPMQVIKKGENVEDRGSSQRTTESEPSSLARVQEVQRRGHVGSGVLRLLNAEANPACGSPRRPIPS